MNCESESSRIELNANFGPTRCGYGWGTAFQRYGGPWRDARRIIRQEFDVEAVKKYRIIEEKASHLLLRNLLEKPDDVLEHLRQYVLTSYAHASRISHQP